MAGTTNRLDITQIATVIVPVSNQDEAVDFYTNKLGFEKRVDVPFGNGDRWVEVAPAGAASTLALMPPQPGEPIGVDTRVAFSTTDIDSDHADMQAQGVDVDAQVARMGGPVPPMFFFRDGDGNTLLVVQTS